MRRGRRWWWLAVVPLALLGWWFRGYWREHRFDSTIDVAAARYRVDPALVKAVIWRESAFRPWARGPVGEIGLMQLQELAAIEWAGAEKVTGFEMEHLVDPRTNILAGTWYLARVMRRYRSTDDPVPYALADYNAGRMNVLRWNNGAAATNAEAFIAQIGFPMTRRYVESVRQQREHYRSDFSAR